MTEREPYALWQHDGELFVIAADGTVDRPRCGTTASPNLPLVVGDEANARTKDYLALLDAAGPLKPRIRAGTLVSGRRWTLKLDNGVDVRLPELGRGRRRWRASSSSIASNSSSRRTSSPSICACPIASSSASPRRPPLPAPKPEEEATRGKGVDG